MKRFKNEKYGMDAVIKEPTDSKGFCEGCLYWDERTHWCDELESYGNADTTWSCERWVDKDAYR